MPGDPAPEQEPKRVQDLYQDYAAKRDRGERGQLPSPSPAGVAAVADATKSTATTPSPPAAGAVDGAAATSATPAAADPTKSGAGTKADKPKTGNTIYVSGNRLTEEFLHKQFDGFGKIVNISMEIEKGRGFITFGKTDAAEQAIKELDGKSVGGVQLLVQLARRQPQIDPINDASSSATWSTLGRFYHVPSMSSRVANACFFCYSDPISSRQSIAEGHTQAQSQVNHLREPVRLDRQQKQPNHPSTFILQTDLFFKTKKNMCNVCGHA